MRHLFYCWSIRLDNWLQVLVKILERDEPVVSFATTDVAEFVVSLLVMQRWFSRYSSFGHLFGLIPLGATKPRRLIMYAKSDSVQVRLCAFSVRSVSLVVNHPHAKITATEFTQSATRSAPSVRVALRVCPRLVSGSPWLRTTNHDQLCPVVLRAARV